MESWIESQPSLTQKRICNILTPLRNALARAKKLKKIPSNPLADLKTERRQVDVLRKAQCHDDLDPFSMSELKLVVQHLEPQAKNYAIFNAWTGLRVEDMIELRWEDVDFEKRHVRVSRTRTRGQVIGPKTSAGRRDIKLLDEAMQILMDQKQYTYLHRGYVFHNPRTAAPYLDDKAFREQHWRGALLKAGIRYRPPRQLRHTYASWMVGSGDNIKWVSAQMGHESTQITLDTYARWLPDSNPNAGSYAESAWKRSGHETEGQKSGSWSVSGPLPSQAPDSMVEAAGIEPASASTPPLALHA